MRRASLWPSSPAYAGTRRFDLVGDVKKARGKAVVLSSDSEYTQIAAATEAGAAAILLVRPPGVSAGLQWDPDAQERLAVPTVVLTSTEGQAILDRAGRPGASVALTLTTVSPYLYDVSQVSRQQVPAKVVHRVSESNSRRITVRYSGSGDRFVGEERTGWRPWVSYPRPGEQTETWYASVVRPATPKGAANVRVGDALRLRVAAYVDATDEHWLVGDLAYQGSMTAKLYCDGKLLTELPDGWRDVPVPGGAATYRLALTTARPNYPATTSTEWTFRSARSGDLPLLQISYDAPVELGNTATTRAHRLGVSVPGARTVKVETSGDEGRTWVEGTRVPAGRGTVSLRVTATDRAGNSVKQTVLRAYARS